MITGMPRVAIAVSDFDRTVATFRERLGMPVIDFSDSSVESLGAKLAMCVPPGGSNIELMCPAAEDAPLSQSLRRFLKRRGEGLFALMLEAPVPDEEAECLLENGLKVLPLMPGAGGRDIHPSSTHGVLIRVYPVNSFPRTMNETDDSMGLSGIARVVIAVRELHAATETYRGKLNLAADAAVGDAERGVSSMLVRPSSGGVIELVSPADTSRPFAAQVAAHIENRGEGLFELVLQSNDLASVAGVLGNRGLAVVASGDSLTLAKPDTCGAQIRIERTP